MKTATFSLATEAFSGTSSAPSLVVSRAVVLLLRGFHALRSIVLPFGIEHVSPTRRE